MARLKEYNDREDVQPDMAFILTFVIGPEGGVNGEGLRTLARAKFGCFKYLAETLLPEDRYELFAKEWGNACLSDKADVDATFHARADMFGKHLNAHIKGIEP